VFLPFVRQIGHLWRERSRNATAGDFWDLGALVEEGLLLARVLLVQLHLLIYLFIYLGLFIYLFIWGLAILV